jgi:hypothetical protein
MLPKNGCRGISIPLPKMPTIRLPSKRMSFAREYGKSSSRKPAVARNALMA